jgi:hypothetical protein
MYDKDLLLAAIGASVGLAGLLLIFCGFLYSRSEAFGNADRIRRYRRVAQVGLIPFASALFSALLCTLCVQGPADYSSSFALLLFKMSLVLTLTYGIISMIWFL